MERKKNILRYLVVVLAVILAYGNTLTLNYTLDDRMIIFENNYTLKGWAGAKEVLTKDAFTGYFGDNSDLVAGGRYRPLSQLTFIAEYELFGGKVKEQVGRDRAPQNEQVFSESVLPVIQHAGNVLLFILLCITVLAVLQLLFPQAENDKWWLSLPFIATMLFALHPLHTEAIANIKGRDEIMCMLGAMLTLFASLKYLEKRGWHWLVVAFFAMLFGIFSKENAITFLAVVPLAIFFSKREKKALDYILPLVPILLASGLFLWARYNALGGFMNGAQNTLALNNPFVQSTKAQEIATVIITWGIYLKLLIFPHPLTHDYYPNQIEITDFANPVVWILVVAILALIAYAIWKLPKKNVVSFAILFFVITFSITSNLLFNVGTFMNERFVFTSLLGFALIFAFLTQKFAVLTNSKRIIIPIFTLVFCLYGAKTFARNLTWHDDIKLFTTDVRVSDKSQKCNLSAGGSYLKLYDREHKAKYLALAEKHLMAAVKLGRSDADTYSLLGKLYFTKKDYAQAEWCYRAILAADPTDELAAKNLEVTLAMKGSKTILKINELIENDKVDDALAMINSHLQEHGETAEMLNALGRIYGEKRGNIKQAIAYLEKAVAMDPDFASAQENLGIAYAISGQLDLAVQHLERAHELDPENQRVLNNLAQARQQRMQN